MTSEPGIDDLLNSPVGLAMFEFLLRWNRGTEGISDAADRAIVSILSTLPAMVTEDDIRDIRSRLLNLGPLIGRPVDLADMAALQRIETLLRQRNIDPR